MEEAEVKAGGPDKLKRAVAEGRVKKQMKDGVEFYLFPNMKAGQRTSFNTGKTLNRQKNITEAQFKMVSDMMKKLGWNIGVTQQDLEASNSYLHDFFCFLFVAHLDYFHIITLRSS